MIIAIRISGLVEMQTKVEETLFRTRLRRKYAAVLLKPTAENQKLLLKLRNFIAYGDINKETLALLIQKRGMPKVKGKKIDVDKVIESLEKKNFNDLEIKPFFRLHPPRGGIDSKNHFGTSRKAVLGDNKNAINDILRRML
ncbi:hypothetical protein J4408_02255 [Candidatus Pacearchaeota archaeon]|nr:hypothetical protein [Candidatus Pacearchaeota archaeon]